jgi:hypothetical protein
MQKRYSASLCTISLHQDKWAGNPARKVLEEASLYHSLDSCGYQFSSNMEGGWGRDQDQGAQKEGAWKL